MSEPLPIETLIVKRAAELGLKPNLLVQRCGYKNVHKGIRRLRDLYAGSFEGAGVIVGGLPTALELPETVVSQALEESRRIVDRAIEAARASEEIAWRTSFVPHAVIVAERSVPEPIFIAALIGVPRLLLIEFDLQFGETTFPLQAKNGIAKKLAEWGRNDVPAKALPAFGCPIGFFVNYSPDRAVEFDLEMNPIKERTSAFRPGRASLKFGKRTVPQGLINVSEPSSKALKDS